VIRQMFGGTKGHPMLEPWHLELAGMALAIAVIEEKLEWFERLVEAPAWAYAAALSLTLLVLEIFGVIDAQIPFIYFQF
jgi:hypothetical protein